MSNPHEDRDTPTSASQAPEGPALPAGTIPGAVDLPTTTAGHLAEERFRLLADSIPQIVWLTDAEGRNEFFNRQWTAYTGADGRDSTASEIAASFLHPDDVAPTLAAWDRAQREGRTFQVEHRIRSAAGEYRWFLVRAEPHRDPGTGAVVRWFGTSTDIHDQKQAERALRESEARFRVLADLSPDATWVNLDDRLVYANAAAARLIGAADPGDLLGRSPFDFVDPGNHPRLRERIRSMLEIRGAAPLVEMRWRRLDGSAVDVESAAGAITWEGRPAIQVVFRDVTERRRTEEALRRSESKYRMLFESMDQGFCVIQVLFDGEGRPVDYRFLEGNPAWERHTGLENAIGRTARELLPTLEEHWFQIYGRVAATGEPIRFESGSEVMGRWFDVFAFRTGEPESGKVALLFSEVSDRRRAEQERELLLRESERARAEAEAARSEAETANRAKADFLAAMSHELRTPLNAIGGYVELLDLGIHGPLTEAQRGALTRVAANQRHLLMLINDVLAFARVEAGRVELDVRPLAAPELLGGVEPLVAPLARARGIALSVRECEAGLRVLGDEERVRQILLNLVGNAIKFTPEGGWVLLSAQASGEWVELGVRDNGPGISAEKQERIFDPFVQVDRRLDRPQDGVGLGLAISRDLARAMGCELTVESAPGEGSTFTLRMPRVGAEGE